jgi:hypothetical protein
MSTTYTYTVLRYVHDAMTGEYANVGVVVYAPACKYIGARCTAHRGRLSRMFDGVEGDHIRSLLRYIQDQVNERGRRLREELPLAKPSGLMEIATQVLPADDSSLQWSPPGGGVADAPDAVLDALYARLVARYEGKPHAHGRNEEEVWRVFKAPLASRAILPRLQPKLIRSQMDEYEFGHAWKNGQWHVYEPVSFDLIEPDAILGKAHRWVGRGVGLQKSEEPFMIHMLLGGPREQSMRPVYTKAENLLNQIPVPHEFVREDEAERFAQNLAAEMAEHAWAGLSAEGGPAAR